jgi:hypothetical protein
MDQEHFCGNQAADGNSYPRFPDNCRQQKAVPQTNISCRSLQSETPISD